MNIKEYRLGVIKTVFLIFALVGSQYSIAQKKVYNEEITVVSSYEPSIPEAFKINQNPVIDDTSAKVPIMKYILLSRPAEVKIDLNQLMAARPTSDVQEKLGRNFIKAGIGNYKTLYGEIFASTLQSTDFMVGAHLKHLSTQGTIDDYAPAGTMDDLVELYGQKYFNTHTLSANLWFDRYESHYYGFKPAEYDTIISRDKIKQRFVTFGGEVSLASNYKDDSKLNHKIGVSFYHLNDLKNFGENNIRINLDLNKPFVDLFKLNDTETIGGIFELDAEHYFNSSGSVNSTLLRLNPYISTNIDEYTLKAGLNYYTENNNNQTLLHVFPQIEGGIKVVPEYLEIFAGLGGGIDQSTLKGFIDKNPYILTDSVTIRNKTDKFKVYFGFRSSLSRLVNFNGGVNYAIMHNLPLFITNISGTNFENTFRILYADVNELKIHGEIEFVKEGRFDFGLGGSYSSFSKSSETHVWYTPDYVITLRGKVNVTNELALKMNAKLNGPVWAAFYDSPLNIYNPKPPVEISQWTDISLGGEYLLMKKLSLFLDVNNIANSRYFRYFNYPSYGVNVLGGVTYCF